MALREKFGKLVLLEETEATALGLIARGEWRPEPQRVQGCHAPHEVNGAPNHDGFRAALHHTR